MLCILCNVRCWVRVHLQVSILPFVLERFAISAVSSVNLFFNGYKTNVAMVENWLPQSCFRVCISTFVINQERASGGAGKGVSGLDCCSPYNLLVLHCNTGEDVEVANSVLECFLLNKMNYVLCKSCCVQSGAGLPEVMFLINYSSSCQTFWSQDPLHSLILLRIPKNFYLCDLYLQYLLLPIKAKIFRIRLMHSK